MDTGIPICSLCVSQSMQQLGHCLEEPEKNHMCSPQLPMSSLAPLDQAALLLSAFQHLQVVSHSSLHQADIKINSSYKWGERNGQQLHGQEVLCHLLMVWSTFCFLWMYSRSRDCGEWLEVIKHCDCTAWALLFPHLNLKSGLWSLEYLNALQVTL